MTPLEQAIVDQQIAAIRDDLGPLIMSIQQLTADVGREQAICDMTALLAAFPATYTASVAAVALAVLADREG